MKKNIRICLRLHTEYFKNIFLKYEAYIATKLDNKTLYEWTLLHKRVCEYVLQSVDGNVLTTLVAIKMHLIKFLTLKLHERILMEDHLKFRGYFFLVSCLTHGKPLECHYLILLLTVCCQLTLLKIIF